MKRTDTFTVEDPGWSLDVSWAYRAGDYPPFDDPVFVVLNDGLHPLAAVSNSVGQTIIPNLVGAFGYHKEITGSLVVPVSTNILIIMQITHNPVGR